MRTQNILIVVVPTFGSLRGRVNKADKTQIFTVLQAFLSGEWTIDEEGLGKRHQEIDFLRAFAFPKIVFWRPNFETGLVALGDLYIHYEKLNFGSTAIILDKIVGTLELYDENDNPYLLLDIGAKRDEDGNISGTHSFREVN